MRYIIIPSSVFDSFNIEVARQYGLDKPRRSVDGTKVIMHVENYELLVNSVEDSTPRLKSRSVYPVYESDDSEFKELMESSQWTIEEKNYNPN